MRLTNPSKLAAATVMSTLAAAATLAGGQLGGDVPSAVATSARPGGDAVPVVQAAQAAPVVVPGTLPTPSPTPTLTLPSLTPTTATPSAQAEQVSRGSDDRDDDLRPVPVVQHTPGTKPTPQPAKPSPTPAPASNPIGDLLGALLGGR